MVLMTSHGLAPWHATRQADPFAPVHFRDAVSI
jgi:hypothetical protein